MEANNMMAMREALNLCYRIIHCAMVTGVINRDDATKAMDAYHSALTAPPRNCDVGSDEEQTERFIDYCSRCEKSRMDIELIRDRSRCIMRWEQMPYTEEEGAK